MYYDWPVVPHQLIRTMFAAVEHLFSCSEQSLPSLRQTCKMFCFHHKDLYNPWCHSAGQQLKYLRKGRQPLLQTLRNVYSDGIFLENMLTVTFLENTHGKQPHYPRDVGALILRAVSMSLCPLVDSTKPLAFKMQQKKTCSTLPQHFLINDHALSDHLMINWPRRLGLATSKSQGLSSYFPYWQMVMKKALYPNIQI